MVVAVEGMLQRSVIYETVEDGGGPVQGGSILAVRSFVQLAIESLLSRQPRNQRWADHKPLVLMMFCTTGWMSVVSVDGQQARPPDVSTFARAISGERGVGVSGQLFVRKRLVW